MNTPNTRVIPLRQVRGGRKSRELAEAATPKAKTEEVKGKIQVILDAISPEAYQGIIDTSKTPEALHRGISSIAVERSLDERMVVFAFFLFLQQHYYVWRVDLPRHVNMFIRAYAPGNQFFLEYIAERNKTILSDNKGKPYEEIGFCLVGFGMPESYNLRKDIEKDHCREISSLFNQYLFDLGQLFPDSNPKPTRARKTPAVSLRQQFDSKIDQFVALCEVVNKLALINSVNVKDKAIAFNLSEIIERCVSDLMYRLEVISYDRGRLNKLKYLAGKIINNYSHLRFVNGSSETEIQGKIEEILEREQLGLLLQRQSEFGGDPSEEESSLMIYRGNVRYIELVGIFRLEHQFQKTSEELKRKKHKCLTDLRAMYRTSKGAELGHKTSEDVLEHFMSMHDHDEFQIETIHHLVLFDTAIRPELLAKLLVFFTSQNRYFNILHEEFKIKIISAIVDKIGALPDYDRYLGLLATALQRIEKNRINSEFVISYSRAFISFAVVFALSKEESYQNLAKQSYIHFSRINNKQHFFQDYARLFMQRIGGQENFRAYEKMFDIEAKFQVQSEILGHMTAISQGITNGANESLVDSINAVICSIISEKLFYGICSVELEHCGDGKKDCQKHGSACDSCSSPMAAKGKKTRTHSLHSINVNNGYFLHFRYPVNIQAEFHNVFTQHQDFIANGITTLITNITDKIHLARTVTERDKANTELTGALAELDSAYRENEFMRTHDRETRLPNMEKFREDIETPGKKTILLYRIEKYDSIVEKFGYQEAKKVLREIAEILQSMEVIEWYNTETYCINIRTFAIIITDPVTLDICTTALERLDTRLEKSLGYRIASVKSLIHEDEKDLFEKVMDSLSMARYSKGVYQHDAGHVSLTFRDHLEFAQIVDDALDESNKDVSVVPYFQPIRNNKTGKIEKVEVLARIKHGDDIIFPDRFIDVAKERNKLPRITRRMIEMVMPYLRDRQDIVFSINLDKPDFEDSELMAYLESIASSGAIDPKNVCIEIVESAMFADYDAESSALFARLRACGFQIAMDDFWVKNSNAQSARIIDPHVIKVDGIFVKDVVNADGTVNDRAFRHLKGLVDMGHTFGCEVVVEYVDSPEIQSILDDLGVEYSQGWLYGKAAPELPHE